MVKKIEVSDETYELIKDQLVDKAFSGYKDYVVVRSSGAGCFAGVLEEQDDNTRKVVLSNVRRLWYWDGAASLSQLAMEGVKSPENCKFSMECGYEEIFDVLEIIQTREAAQKSIREVWVWKN